MDNYNKLEIYVTKIDSDLVINTTTIPIELNVYNTTEQLTIVTDLLNDIVNIEVSEYKSNISVEVTQIDKPDIIVTKTVNVNIICTLVPGETDEVDILYASDGLFLIRNDYFLKIRK